MLVSVLSAVLTLSAQLSPFTISAGINGKTRSELVQIWQQLGVEPITGLFTGYQDHIQPLSATVQSLDLNGDMKKDAVITVTNGWDYQYLVFLDLTKWTFVGNIDLEAQKYAPPAAHVEWSGEGGSWFVIYQLDGSGTGVLLEIDHWYEVSSKGISETLSVPVNGNACDMSPYWREFSAKVIRVTKNSVIYQFKARYFVWPYEKDDPDELDLFSYERNGIFRYETKDHKFHFDAANSQITADQIEHLYVGGRDDLILYYLDDLKKLAVQGNLLQKAWLRSYLKESGDSAGKKALLAILDK